jgi:phospho-N-acetylmuramoyl-pentapeptide-transferase
MLYILVQLYSKWLDEHGLFSVARVLYQIEFRAFFAVVLSFSIVLLFGNRVIAWLARQKIGDAPEFYREDVNKLMAAKAATPTMGGVLVCGAIVVTLLLLADLRNAYVYIGLIVLVWLAVVGGFDDWLKLTASRRETGRREGMLAWEKLLFQLGIAAVAGYFLYRNGISQDVAASATSAAPDAAVHVLNLPFQRTYDPRSQGLQLEGGVIVLGMIPFMLIATLLIAGTSNAVNLTDGMDGLAAGTLMIAGLVMMALAFIAGDVQNARFLLLPYVDGTLELTVVAGAMAGACLGFLWFNCAPARVFMGDTGSLALGGLLAYIAVAIRQEILLLIIGGVFYMEMASVMLQVGFFKWTKGRRIFRCSPIHHHFHLGGWSEQQVVTRFWILGVVFAMIALVSIKLR